MEKEVMQSRKVFPGANTPQGFFSFYSHILSPGGANRIFVLKGGPGTGKSTLIRKIGEDMAVRGYKVEFHCCSSDNGSLDGVCIPEIGVALLDGTAPHVVDPKNPGAVDEIINLGDYWDEASLCGEKEAILALNKEVGRLFRRAYDYLAQARILADEAESYYSDSNALDVPGLNSLGRGLETLIFSNRAHPQASNPRHLFASAITPEGAVNHLKSIFDPLNKRYIIRGPAGSGKATLLKKLYHAAVSRGLEVEAFHCSLRPEEIEHLVLPELGAGIITGCKPHEYRAFPGDMVLDTREFVSSEALLPFQEDLKEADRRYTQAFSRAVDFIKRAKAAHDEMELHYIPHMDFEGINACRERVAARIAGYCS